VESEASEGKINRERVVVIRFAGTDADENAIPRGELPQLSIKGSFLLCPAIKVGGNLPVVDEDAQVNHPARRAVVAGDEAVPDDIPARLRHREGDDHGVFVFVADILGRSLPGVTAPVGKLDVAAGGVTWWGRDSVEP